MPVSLFVTCKMYKLPLNLLEVELYLKMNGAGPLRSSARSISFSINDQKVTVNYVDDETFLFVMNVNGKHFKYTMHCDKFADERILRFTKVCAKLKSLLLAQARN
jgi:hypothetical protein